MNIKDLFRKKNNYNIIHSYMNEWNCSEVEIDGIGRIFISSFSGESKQIPHIHLISENGTFKSCICLHTNRYYIHGDIIDRFNNVQLKQLDNHLSALSITSLELTNWEKMIKIWNRRFISNDKFKFIEKPDYTKMTDCIIDNKNFKISEIQRKELKLFYKVHNLHCRHTLGEIYIGKFIGIVRIFVYDNDNIDIPHFHLESNDGDFHCSLRIDVNGYFNHGIYNDRLLSKNKLLLDKALDDISDYDDNKTNWEYMCEIWNEQFPEEKKYTFTEKPDYTKMTESIKDKKG